MNRELTISCGQCQQRITIEFNAWGLLSGEFTRDQITGAIADGWRYVKKWGEFLCPACSGKFNPEGVVKPKLSTAEESQRALAERAEIKIRALRSLREMEAWDEEKRV